ncbi:MAG: hypothetical protein FWF69_05825 [Firmicutes bacterium]|nr:hypothetical protein [Bacillota bacterium]
MILKPEMFEKYIALFSSENAGAPMGDTDLALQWLTQNVPLFECPDKDIEEVYFFRWWVYSQHVKRTADGYIITEFHPNVPWAGKHNAIVCAAGHHIREGRWLADKTYMEDYIRFWYQKGGPIRAYSNWLGAAVWQYCAVKGDFNLAASLLDDFVMDYGEWERTNLHESGLFWSGDDRDGMEFSISGSGLRPTLNSYMYGYASTISKTAKLAGKKEVSVEFDKKARALRRLINEKLWDPNSGFYKVLPLDAKGLPLNDWNNVDPARNVRELLGYTPWYFDIPDNGKDGAWRRLTDHKGFNAPFGPTTVERSHPRFMSAHQHECLWNGPSWPFATSVTLTAMLNSSCARDGFFHLLRAYARCHTRRTKSDGTAVRWLDENINPFTGEWLSRSILESWGWPAEKGGFERGKYYNHSTYCDLIITGLAGLKPRSDDIIEVRPLIPDSWDYFCLDSVSYHGRSVTILYDKCGERYGIGKGAFVCLDGTFFLL